ncbi:BglG family transcription antiterminator [Saliterribacillus persicus]|uniref:BglG family transcriptional antiterminator n=1 Tax=Saliterribacillus persicus TaxID=930114 RepID=A0A368Y9I7_9BACI|nr:BglG family transcription antiterminator [Saliterribacillus persicus]RCW76913.1 BglG family transcriptional antiterminator [Saliterribacillus persicus]
MYISGRERKIIETLLAQTDAITIRQLATELDVSERTVHRDLKNAEEILHDYELAIEKRSGVGIQLVGESEKKQQLKLAIFHVEHTDYTPLERQALILSTLLEAKEPIKLYALADDLTVTIATVSNDLDGLENLLAKYKLNLVRKRGYGVKIEGAESNKRSAISYLISKHVSESDVITLIKRNIEKQSQQQTDTISNRLLGLVDQSKLAVIEQTIDRVRKKLPYELADSAYVGLVVHLALALERLHKGENIQFDPTYLVELEGNKEYDIAADILKELEQVFQIEIPEDEIGYITMHLLGAKLRYDHGYLLEESSMDIAYKAKALIEYVSIKLDKDLFYQEYIMNDLVAHLKPAIYRLQQGMNIKNPLAEEIETDYVELFTIIEEAVAETFPGVYFPREEVAFLVLHFASALLKLEEDISLKALVICSSGIGTSKMLASKISQQFQEITAVDNYSLFELESLDKSSYDLIVSTVPIKNMEGKYILASPILTKTDIHHIKRTIRKIKMTNTIQRKELVKEKTIPALNKQEFIKKLINMKQYSTAILSIFDQFKVYPPQENIQLESALSHSCELLHQQELITDKQELVTQLIKRADIGGLGIPGTSLALFHTRSNQVKKAHFSIHPLKQAILIDGMDGSQMEMKNLLLMISPVEADEATLEILSFISGLLIKDEDNMVLFQTQDEEKIRDYLAEQLHVFLHEKIN